MSDLMENLFQFLQEERISKYLAQDPNYQKSARLTECCLNRFSESLDYPTGQLLDQYLEAVCTLNRCTEQAVFLASLELCRELHDAF